MQSPFDALRDVIRNSPYQLRQTADRQSGTLTQRTTNTSSNHSNINPINTFQFRTTTQATRFCGRVESSNPDKSRLDSHSVNQWLADADSRTPQIE